MSTLAERTFIINTQAVGTIELTATLETANASLASYITENRTYLDGVRAGIDSDLATLTAEANTERGSAYNKNFGILDNTVAEGSHVHDDRYYTKANVQSLLDGFQLLIETEETGFNLPLGNTANTVAAGNDPRFSDAREPIAHSHTKSAITDFDEADYATAAQGALADSALQPADADERYYSQYTVDNLLRDKVTVFERNTGFNLPLGTEQNTVARGDHTHTHFNHEITSETTHSFSAFNVLTTKNYVDEKVRQLLESEGFVFKHNEMLLLDGDDHLQYHTDARGDARYPLIQDLAAEITDRTAADNAINGNITANETARAAQRISDLSDIAENIQDVDDAAVHILGDQIIDGEKKFIGDVIVEGEAILQNVTIKSQSELDVGDAIVLLNAGETGTPSVNAGFEIERGTSTNAQLLFDESADQWVAGIKDALKPLASENYVDDNFVGLSGNEDIAGNKTLTGFTNTDGTLSVNGNLTSVNAFINIAKALRGPATTDEQDGFYYTTKGYIEDNFLSLDGGTLDGNIEFAPSSGNAIQILNAVGDGLSGFRFESDGDSYAFVYLKPENDELRIEKRTANAGFSSNELVLFDTYSAFSKEVRGPDPTNNAGFTPKKYVEDNFLSLDGGIITGDNVAFPRIEFDVDTGKSGGLAFKVDGTLVGTISGSSDFLYLLGPNGSYFSIQPTFTFTNVELRGPNPTNNAGYTPKKYVEDNFAPIDSPVFTDQLVIEEDSGRAQIFVRTKDDVSEGQLRFQRGAGNDTSVTMYDLSDRFIIRKHDAGGDSDITMYPTKTVMAKRVEIGGNLDVDGNLTISNPSAVVDAQATSGNPSFRLRDSANGIKAQVLYRANFDDVVLQQVSGDNNLIMSATKSEFNKDVNIGGDLTVQDADPLIKINTTDTSKASRLEMRVNDALRGTIFTEASGAQRTFIEKRGGSVVQNQIVLDNDKTSFSTDLDVTGDITASSTGGTSIQANAPKTAGSSLGLRIDGLLRGLIYTLSDTSIRMRYYNDPANNFDPGSEFEMGDGYTTFRTGDLRSNNFGNTSKSVTTKEYVEDNFVGLDGDQIIKGKKTFEQDIVVESVGDEYAGIKLKGTTSGFGFIDFNKVNTKVGSIVGLGYASTA